MPMSHIVFILYSVEQYDVTTSYTDLSESYQMPMSYTVLILYCVEQYDI